MPGIPARFNLPPFAVIKKVTFFPNWCAFTVLPRLLVAAISPSPHSVPPREEIEATVILDSRFSALKAGQQLNLYRASPILVGHNSYRDAVTRQSALTCIALLKGTVLAAPPEIISPTAQYDTTSTRLIITEQWQTLTIIGEVFVTVTWRGYAPSLLVRTRTGEQRHIIVGAKTFCEPLETIRLQRGSLDGSVLNVRKQGPSQMAPYQVTTENTN